MSFLKFNPCVFVIGDYYEIIAVAKTNGIFCINAFGHECYEENSGVLASEKNYAKIRIPQSALNSTSAYRVIFREAINRKGYFSEMINNGWVYNYDNTDTYYDLKYGLDKDIKLTNANCDIDVSVSIINLSDKDIDIRNSEEIKKTQINKITAEIPYDSKDDFLLSNSISKNSNVSEIKKLWGNPKGEYDYDSSLFYYTYKTSFGKSLSLRIKTSDEKPYFFEFSFGI